MSGMKNAQLNMFPIASFVWKGIFVIFQMNKNGDSDLNVSTVSWSKWWGEDGELWIIRCWNGGLGGHLGRTREDNSVYFLQSCRLN